MKKIIISSVCANLDRFLQSDKEQYFYLLPDLCHADVEEFLEEKKYKKIDIIEGLDCPDFKKEYVDLVGRLNREHNSLNWWATTISYKGTFVSNLCKELFNYYCIISLIKRKNCDYIIVSDNYILNDCIKRYCSENGIDCRLLDKQKMESNIARFRRYFMSNIYFLYDGWMRKILTFLLLSRHIEKRMNSNKGYYIIRSWVDKRSLSEGDRYRDSYFGKLPEYLKEKEIEFFILASILTDYRNLNCKLKRIKSPLIIPQEYFVGYMDYLKVIAFNFINRPKIAKPVSFYGLNITDFLNDSLKKDYEFNEINKNFIYYYYIKGLSKKIKINTFLFPMENQAWERMSILAIQKYSPSTKLIGYVHSLFKPSLLGYFYSKEEEGIIPLPHKILTPGEKFKKDLETAGNYMCNIKLSAGCALRYEHILKTEMVNVDKNGKILVALSMDINYSLKLLRLLRDAFTGNDKYNVILKSHPVLPVEMIIKRYNLKLGDNFKISKNLKFEQDLTNSRVVVYIETTSCIEALMRGVPAIYVDSKELASPDPLFNMNSLKWTVSDKDGLRRTVDYIYNMDSKEHLQKYNEAMLHLKRYFYPVESVYLEKFIS